MRIKKGQIAAEFLMYSAIFIFIVIIAYFAISYMQSSEIYFKKALYVKWFGERFANHINMAINGGEGFYHNYTFPSQLLGKDYALYISNPPSAEPYLLLEWSDGVSNVSFVYPLSPISFSVGNCVSEEKGGEKIVIKPDLGNIHFYNKGDVLMIYQEGC